MKLHLTSNSNMFVMKRTSCRRRRYGRRRRNCLDQEEPDLLYVKEEEEEPDLLHIKEEEEESDLLHIKEEEDKPDLLHIKEEEDKPDLLHIKEEEDKPDLLHIKVKEEEPDLPQIKVEEEHPDLLRIKEEEEKPDVLHIKVEEEDPDLSQIKVEEGEPDLPQIKVEVEDPEPRQMKEEEEITTENMKQFTQPLAAEAGEHSIPVPDPAAPQMLVCQPPPMAALSRFHQAPLYIQTGPQSQGHILQLVGVLNGQLLCPLIPAAPPSNTCSPRKQKHRKRRSRHNNNCPYKKKPQKATMLLPKEAELGLTQSVDVEVEKGLTQHLLQRLLDKIQIAFTTTPLNLDFIEFVCRQELYLLQALSNHIQVPAAIIQTLQELFELVKAQVKHPAPEVTVEITGTQGRPKVLVDERHLKELLDIHLPVPCIAALLGVSRRTIYRRMKENELSARDRYSPITDAELDDLVSSIKRDLPNAGYSMVKGRLESVGHRVPWRRVAACMHRVDSMGIISRLSSLGCVIRRDYSVPGPLSLVHVDTNHKLVRYSIFIFGGIDGFSRKILYLNAATNNCASTAFHFFLEATQKNGLPSRVRANQGVENVDIARFMVTARGNNQGSFISGKSVHNQRIEQLWRYVWISVSFKYYNLLQSLEENDVLDISSIDDIFCVHYAFLPRLKKDLELFTEGWNHHPLRTEGNRSPMQMWETGLMLNNSDVHSENMADLQEPDIDWETAADYSGSDSESETGVVVPEYECPLTEKELNELQTLIDPTDPKLTNEQLYTVCYEHVKRLRTQ